MELPIDDADAALYTVGQVAAMLHVQMAFLRRLDEQGVVVPARSPGGQRRYSRREIDRVTEVVGLINEGLTLTGVRRVLDLQAKVEDLKADLAAVREAGASPGKRRASRDRPGFR
jgi:MerR family transcriptional regulator, heat shock protein HspR